MNQAFIKRLMGQRARDYTKLPDEALLDINDLEYLLNLKVTRINELVAAGIIPTPVRPHRKRFWTWKQTRQLLIDRAAGKV